MSYESRHHIKVEISGGYPHGLRGDIAFRGVCDGAEGAPCRMWCDRPECQEEASEDHGNHTLFDQGKCGVIESLNADPGFIPELYDGPKTHLRPGLIELTQDMDGVTWRYIEDAPKQTATMSRALCAENCRHQCPECRMGLGSHLVCDPRCEHHEPAVSR